MIRDRECETAWACWSTDPGVNIESIQGTIIAAFPIEYLESCGHNTWSYVYDVISLLIEVDAEHPGTICDIRTETPVDLHEAPRPGKFKYVEKGKTSEVSFTLGPTGDISVVPASDTPPSSISRTDSSTLKSDFRTNLLVRDGFCLLTGYHWTKCHATHIVPWNRADVYEMITGFTGDRNSAEAGILLNKVLHGDFDALRWSLYYKDDVYYVHYFLPFSPGDREFNGKAIPLSRFREGIPPPDPRFVRWHYAQTVMSRIRGFSYGFARPEGATVRVSLVEQSYGINLEATNRDIEVE